MLATTIYSPAIVRRYSPCPWPILALLALCHCMTWPLSPLASPYSPLSYPPPHYPISAAGSRVASFRLVCMSLQSAVMTYPRSVTDTIRVRYSPNHCTIASIRLRLHYAVTVCDSVRACASVRACHCVRPACDCVPRAIACFTPAIACERAIACVRHTPACERPALGARRCHCVLHACDCVRSTCHSVRSAHHGVRSTCDCVHAPTGASIS
jgi:hypothetical protein